MSFVDADIVRLGRMRVLKYVFLFGGRIPEAGIINRRDCQILCNAFDPSWQAFNAVAIWEYH